MKNEKNYHDLYEDFVRRLISGDYSLYEEDKELTELIFSSKISFPGLTQIPSYLFKMNYLTEKLSHEFTKINIDVTPQEIIDNILKEKTLIYHKKKMDPQINQDVDYFFVIDSEIFFASGYRRLLEPVDEQFSKRKPEKTFLDISSTDIDDIIENIINLVDFDVSSQPMVDKESLLSLFKKKDPELIIHTNTDEVLSYEKNNISLYIPSDIPSDIPSENSNHVVIRIKTEENPIVDSQVHLAIKDEKKEYYTIRGTIFNEKTLKIGYHYRLDIIIEIKSIKSINNLKAILFFIQN